MHTMSIWRKKEKASLDESFYVKIHTAINKEKHLCHICREENKPQKG